MRFAWLLVVASCGGKMIADTDAGDAATTKDVASDGSPAGDGSAVFSCGEAGHFVQCDPATQYCKLLKSSTKHAYSCELLPVTCTPAASAPYDCGCYQSGAEIFVTLCQ